jgi:hypothetical protein
LIWIVITFCLFDFMGHRVLKDPLAPFILGGMAFGPREVSSFE